MAYAATITYLPTILSGVRLGRDRQVLITIAETEGASTSEATINLGRQYTVHVERVDLTKSAGTAATFNPRLGPATAPTGHNGGILVLAAAAASPISQGGGVGSVVTTDADGKLYWRSTPDAGADNTVTVKIWLRVRS